MAPVFESIVDAIQAPQRSRKSPDGVGGSTIDVRAEPTGQPAEQLLPPLRRRQRIQRSRFRTGDDRLEVRLLQAKIGIEGVHRLGGVAYHDEDFFLVH